MSTRSYEAMFLLENNAATEDWEGVSGKVDTILQKHGASIVVKEKWDERKLAYEIKGHRRATYYLVYMDAPAEAIARIREDVLLTEVILRHLVLALDDPIDVHIQTLAEERERLAEDSRKNALSGWGDSRRRKGGRREDGRSGRDDDDEGYTDMGDDSDDDRGAEPEPRRRPQGDGTAARERPHKEETAAKS